MWAQLFTSSHHADLAKPTGFPGRVTVQVIGWQLAFDTTRKNSSHIVYRTVIISDSFLHERLIRYRDFRRFHRQSKSFGKRIVKAEFPSLTWLRKKPSKDFIQQRQYMLNAYLEEFCRKELPPRAQIALIKLLRLDGSIREGCSDLSDGSTVATRGVRANIIKEEAACEPVSKEGNGVSIESPKPPEFNLETESRSESVDPFVPSKEDCKDKQVALNSPVNRGSSGEAPRRRSSFLASPSSGVFAKDTIAILSSIKNIFGRANELETYALDYVR
uniref:AlNc14C287G10187 protein n=1 Tax=Albugo laibachii Nc14 TaxID=890382 RepID=F0WV44_9STRA|nr:AlNc14C287G10187 [Albugo laibachii Nc14]|eukprot:CCA25281.1 AlNc14C287G10187 [Albugo laibachii Nc14]